MAELPDLSRRLARLSEALQPARLGEIDHTLAATADDAVQSVPKPNFYRWDDATFDTVVDGGKVRLVGGEWTVAERGRQSGKHGRTKGLGTATRAERAAVAALPPVVDREVTRIVRSALED